jgi:hypothetical protein
MIIDVLALILFEHAIELEHIRDRGVDLVTGAIAANDDVFRHAALLQMDADEIAKNRKAIFLLHQSGIE